MKEVAMILLTVGGGLGIFLLGMKHFSEGLQAVSGEGLRKFMTLATKHRMAGIGTGALATAIVQSSSVITVMAVGFVSSGLMGLQQAINVVIGANIGTTATAWIVAFAPSPLYVGLGGLAIGGLLYFFVHKERIHNLGFAILGLGLVFLGLYFMSVGVQPIKENPEISKIFQMMDAQTYFGILKVMLVGLLVTVVIQSSSATVVIVMTLATQGLIKGDVAIAVIFGATIGTTVTAWLAALACECRDAKRTALAHTLSNVIGSIVIFPFIPLVIDGVQALFANDIKISIAFVDTSYAIFRGSIVFVFMKPFTKLLQIIIPQGSGEEKPHLSVLNVRARQSPLIACDQASMEVAFMAESNIDLFETAFKVYDGVSDEKDENHILHREDVLDNVQREITEFLGKIMTSRLPSDVATRARELLRMTDELESISDEFPSIIKVIKRLRRQNQRISDASTEVLKRAHTIVFDFAKQVTEALGKPRGYFPVGVAQAKSKEIYEIIRELRQGQLLRIGQDDPTSPLRVLVELDILNAYNRIRGYYLNVAEILAGGKK